MKSILLATASILAFAGAAAAQETTPGVSFGGDASFGFNDSQDTPEESGFFYEADLNVTFSTTLNNGLVASSTFSIPIVDNNIGNDGLTVDNDFILGLSLEDRGGLFLGDTDFAAERHFRFASMESADFSEQDSETVLRGDSNFANFELSASAMIADAEGDLPEERPGFVGDDYIDQIAIGGSGSFGRFTTTFGYQQEGDFGPEADLDVDGTDDDENEGIYNNSDNGDLNADEQFGISFGTTFGGANVGVGYGRNLTDETSSYGVDVEYALGALTLGVEYVIEPDFDADSYALKADYDSGPFVLSASFGEEVGEEEYDLKVGYRLSEISEIQAGYNDDDGGFAAYRQAIGNNAYFEASYAEVDDAGFDNDEFAGDIREGTTLKVGLAF